MMKKPSIHQLAQNAQDAFIRFPLVILSALIGTIAGIYWVQVSEVSQNVLPMVNLMLTAALGIPLFFSIRMLLEGEGRFKPWSVAFHISAFLVLMGIYFSLPGQDTTQNTFQPYIRYAFYNACIHLFVSFSPFLLNREEGSFWSYNICLFIRILTSLLYSTVLFLGIFLALLALQLLFDLEIDSKIYPQLFILIIGLFNTWIFLAGIPLDKTTIKENALPKELKAFAQYVLLPLLLVYLLILYGYGAKIVLSWNWPRGVVSHLVIWVAVLGVSTLLLLYPYGKRKENQWIKRSARVFYYLLIPLLILLFMAVGIRLGDYGFTVNRYLIFLLGIWMTVICLYFIVRKGEILFIPISLCLVFLLASFGPWGAFEVSERSQIKRLRKILTQADILLGDQLQSEIVWNQEQFPELEPKGKPANALPLNDSIYSEISSIMHYLDDHHGFDGIDSWFIQDMDKLLLSLNRDKLKWQRMQEAQFYMTTMGLHYRSNPGDLSAHYHSFQVDGRVGATSVGGFDYVVDFHINEFEQKEFTINGSYYQLWLNEAEESLILHSGRDSTEIPMVPLMDNILKNHWEERDQTTYIMSRPEVIDVEGADMDLKLEIRHINFQSTSEGKNQLQFVSGFLLIKEK